MKLHHYDLPSRKKQNINNTCTTAVIIALGVTVFMLQIIYYPLFFTNSSQSLPSSSSSSSSGDVAGDSKPVKMNKTSCDLFTGKWVRNPSGPSYTNETCGAFHEYHYCIKNGRPDTDFMNWRWKPDGCDLPIFNPSQFLELLRGKSLAFVGDSVGRNQVQSLICLLSMVEFPVDVSNSTDYRSRRWTYVNYNFTIATFWSPFFVKTIEGNPVNLYLDEFDESWTTKIHDFDYVIISGGHWFNRQLMFYDNSKLVGCRYCSEKNVTNLNSNFGYRRALRTALRAINTNSKGVTFLRTFAPSHFENGAWNAGGDCVRRRPFARNETHLDDYGLELYMTQLEEFKVAEIEGVKKGLKFKLLDLTGAMLMRPDGHPGRYDGRGRNETRANDCLHWCLPGPIDTWNELLLEMLKMI